MKRLVLIAVGAAALAAVPARATEADYKFKIFAGGAYVMPLSDTSVDGDTIEAASAVGWEIGGEWKPFDRFGFELSWLDATTDVEVDGTKVGEVGLQPVNLTFNWHVINGQHFNWYVGPTVAYINWGDLESSAGGSTSIDSETTYGISTGLDLAFGKHLAFVGGLRWLDASADTAGDSLSVDPLFVRIGLAFRF